jgi:hypothetical protein
MSKTKRALVLAATAAFDAAIVAWMAPGYNDAANAIWILLTIESWVFVGLYGLRSRWRVTAGGRGIMRLVGCIAVIGALSTCTILLGDYPGRQFVRLALIAAVGVAVMDLLLTLIAAQRDDNDLR